ncbi:hypothetical protein ACJJIQ_07855 [Microbulbifer sp. ANSA003]|uniref:hypothetical protein n=1 Tax=Microbulbifer sp. ANSA003 TaxID=3243360 RepID=UPI004041D74F
MAASIKISWQQVTLTIVLSIILMFSSTVMLSIYWPSAEPTERMAAGSMLSTLLWVGYMSMGLLAASTWRAAAYLLSLLLVMLGLSALSFL